MNSPNTVKPLATAIDETPPLPAGMRSPQQDLIEEPVELTWYYLEGDQRQGPYTEEKMRGLIASEELTYGRWVWKKGMQDWVVIEQSELGSLLSQTTPPPLTGKKINNVWVWILAFAPVIGLFLEGVVAEMTSSNERELYDAIMNSKFWYVTVLLNIGLSYFDEHRLRQAGHDTRQFKDWFWLVPVYLFKRAELLKQNKAYFIVWCICFGLIVLGAISPKDF